MKGRMLTAVFGLALVAAPAAGQSEWLAAEGTSVALEFRHPAFADEDAQDANNFLNGAYFLSGRVQVPALGAAVVAELPFANGKFETDGEESDGSTMIGNLYIGGELPIMMGAATIVGGLRLPTAPDLDEDNFAASMAGIASSLPDRFDAFIPKALVPQVGVRVGIPGIPVFDVEANLNASYVMYGGEDGADEEEDNDFFIDGGVRAFASFMALRVGAGLEGVAELTGEEDEDFGDRSAYHFGMLADYEIGMVRPGVQFFIPLNKAYSDVTDWMLGLSLEVDLPF